MKKIHTLLGFITLACIFFAGVSSSLAAEPLFFKVTFTGKAYLVDEDNATESKANFKTPGYLLWLDGDYVLICECDQSDNGWYQSNGDTEPVDSGKAIYIADEDVDIWSPYGRLAILFNVRIAYKVKNEQITSAMLSSLGAQIADYEFIPKRDGAIVGGLSIKGKMMPFNKLPEDVQDIFEPYVTR